MPRFTTDFTAIPASDIRVGTLRAGLPLPPSRRDILSSLSGLFCISADTASLIADLFPQADIDHLVETQRLAA
jgi:hypothetical protein